MSYCFHIWTSKSLYSTLNYLYLLYSISHVSPDGLSTGEIQLQHNTIHLIMIMIIIRYNT